MKLKLSRFYLNTLLGGLIGLLTLVLVLLYFIQSSDLLSPLQRMGKQTAAETQPQTIAFEQKISLLENLNQQQEIQFAAQRATFINDRVEYKRQIAELIAKANIAEQARLTVESDLDQQNRKNEKLKQQIEAEQAEILKISDKFASYEAELESLQKQLSKEKQLSTLIRAEHEKDKIRAMNQSIELTEKKRELVRNKRRLARNEQILHDQTRELSISKGRHNDQQRKSESLNRQISLLNEELRTLRELARKPGIAAASGTQSNVN